MGNFRHQPLRLDSPNTLSERDRDNHGRERSGTNGDRDRSEFREKNRDRDGDSHERLRNVSSTRFLHIPGWVSHRPAACSLINLGYFSVVRTI